MATRGRTESGEVVFFDDDTGEVVLTLGDATKPTIPVTTPTAEQIAVALETLGLVTRSD